MTRLWHCTVEIKLMVQAEDEEDAVALAEEHAPAELDNRQAPISVREVKSAKDVPFEFGGTLPWGGDGEQTVDEIMKARGS